MGVASSSSVGTGADTGVCIEMGWKGVWAWMWHAVDRKRNSCWIACLTERGDPSSPNSSSSLASDLDNAKYKINTL